MARRPRYDYPGSSYHVTSRGNNRGRVQYDDVDCGIWQRTLACVVGRYSWDVLAYCLLTNHFHIVVRAPTGGLSDGMCLLNGGYARQVNGRHPRLRHGFGRRFLAEAVEGQAGPPRALPYLRPEPGR